jgi:hypothetical protein
LAGNGNVFWREMKNACSLNFLAGNEKHMLAFERFGGQGYAF